MRHTQIMVQMLMYDMLLLSVLVLKYCDALLSYAKTKIYKTSFKFSVQKDNTVLWFTFCKL